MSGGWRPALRIARRDARRARGRSALIVAMIALPVLGLTAVDVLLRTGQLDPDERVAFTLGATQARLEALGNGKVLQAPDPDAGLTTTGETLGAAPRLRNLAPAGLRILEERSGSVQTTTRGGVGTVGWSEVAAGDPAFRGRFFTLAGRAARTPDEVAVTPKLLARLGVAIGEEVELTQPARTLRVTGVIDEPLVRSQQTFFALPGALGARPAGTERLFLAGSRPVTWADVLALNERGVSVYSRSVMLDPPARSAVPFYTQVGDPGAGPDPILYIGVALVIALATLEVVLLAGAAFAVGARRQERSLALIAACGGEERHLRHVVLGGGLVLGAAGALAGVAGGVAVAAIAVPILADLSNSLMGRFDVRPLELGAIALLGTITGLLAALLPARLAARQDPLQALTGRRGSVRTPRKAPLLGVLVVCAGVAGSAIGSAVALSSSTGLNAAVILIAGGAVLTQLGLIAAARRSSARAGAGRPAPSRRARAARPATAGAALRRSRRVDGGRREHRTGAVRHGGRRPGPARVLAHVAAADRRRASVRVRRRSGRPGDARGRVRRAAVLVVYSPAAARKLGLDVVPGTLALRFTDRLPSTAEEDAAVAALADAGIEASLSVERGYQSDYGIGLLALALGAALITLGAAGIATGLAQADARDDHATLAAIGAAPRVRKTLAAAQSLTIAGLGTALGVLAGFVPALALIGAVDSLDLVVPWALLAMGIAGVPLLAAGAAWLLTRSRLPLRSRLA